MKPRGFTILEILVVVSILILLASGFMFSSGNLRKKSRDQRRKSDLLAIQSALELYQTINKRYPTNCIAGSPGVGISSLRPDPYSGHAVVAWPAQDKWINDAPRSAPLSLCQTSGTGSTGSVQFTPAYLNIVPVDPLNNNTYFYRYRTNGQYGPSFVSFSLPFRYEIDARLEIEPADNDNGDCSTRFEIFNSVNNLLGC